eukprot:1952972-Pleurochrysis_carterae.AAC.1
MSPVPGGRLALGLYRFGGMARAERVAGAARVAGPPSSLCGARRRVAHAPGRAARRDENV